MKDLFTNILCWILAGIITLLFIVSLPITLPILLIAGVVSEVKRRKQLKVLLGEKNYEKMKIISKNPDMTEAQKQTILNL